MREPTGNPVSEPVDKPVRQSRHAIPPFQWYSIPARWRAIHFHRKEASGLGGAIRYKNGSNKPAKGEEIKINLVRPPGKRAYVFFLFCSPPDRQISREERNTYKLQDVSKVASNREALTPRRSRMRREAPYSLNPERQAPAGVKDIGAAAQSTTITRTRAAGSSREVLTRISALSRR